MSKASERSVRLADLLSSSFEELQRAYEAQLLFNRMLRLTLQQARASGSLDEFTDQALETLLSPIESDFDSGLSGVRIALRLAQPQAPIRNAA